MKKLSRLTALLLALMMISSVALASEMGDGIPMGAFDADLYYDLLTAAEDDYSIPMDLPCREDDPYCAMVEELVNLPTAQQRYDYMMSHYSEEGYDVTLEGMMLHYAFSGLNHTPVNVICTCDFPSVAPEYMPGALDVHKADCPWRFDNLSKAEQFTVIGQMTPEEKAPYLSLLTPEELEELLSTMILVDNQMMHIGTGEAMAEYNEETGELKDLRIGLIVAVYDAELGKFVPAENILPSADNLSAEQK